MVRSVSDTELFLRECAWASQFLGAGVLAGLTEWKHGCMDREAIQRSPVWMTRGVWGLLWGTLTFSLAAATTSLQCGGHVWTRRLGSEDLSCKEAFQHSAEDILVVLDKSHSLCASGSHLLISERQCKDTHWGLPCAYVRTSVPEGVEVIIPY